MYSQWLIISLMGIPSSVLQHGREIPAPHGGFDGTIIYTLGTISSKPCLITKGYLVQEGPPLDLPRRGLQQAGKFGKQ